MQWFGALSSARSTVAGSQTRAVAVRSFSGFARAVGWWGPFEKDPIFVLIVGVLDEQADCDKTVTKKALAILDLRLERWLDVVVPMPCAFKKAMRIGYDAEGRLYAFCIAPRKQTATTLFPPWRYLSMDEASKDISVVTWRGPIGYVKMRCLMPVKGALLNKVQIGRCK